MWIKLGDNEMVNLDHIYSIKKGSENNIEIRFMKGDYMKILPFGEAESRDRAFDRIIKILVQLGMAIE